MNEPFFNGHFPEHPIMPGVLIIEAMAQAAGILGFKMPRREARRRHPLLLRRFGQAALRQPVLPGDQLQLHAKFIKREAQHLEIRPPRYRRRQAGMLG
ncbi:hypothetical protein ACPA9J_32960 [Pseudomonas aeruginosa]